MGVLFTDVLRACKYFKLSRMLFRIQLAHTHSALLSQQQRKSLVENVIKLDPVGSIGEANQSDHKLHNATLIQGCIGVLNLSELHSH